MPDIDRPALDRRRFVQDPGEAVEDLCSRIGSVVRHVWKKVGGARPPEGLLTSR